MNSDKPQKIKILQCSNCILWYNKHIGEEFDVEIDQEHQVWVREKDVYRCLNFVLKSDCEIV